MPAMPAMPLISFDGMFIPHHTNQHRELPSIHSTSLHHTLFFFLFHFHLKHRPSSEPSIINTTHHRHHPSSTTSITNTIHHHQHMKSDVGKKGAGRVPKQRPCSMAGLTA
jgi:hypothetical protein